MGVQGRCPIIGGIGPPPEGPMLFGGPPLIPGPYCPIGPMPRGGGFILGFIPPIPGGPFVIGKQ